MKNYLLIDLSYACFYKFYATKKWYNLANPDFDLSNVEDWNDVPDFINKFSYTFLNDIKNLKKKTNVPWENVILVKDCPRKKIWRHDLVDGYKGTRSNMQKKFNGSQLFIHTYNTLIPQWIKDFKVKLLSCDRAEADDIIGIVTKYLDKDKNIITIIANDNDYLQLLANERINMANMKYKLKDHDNHKKNLKTKILIGDVSDNIPPCYVRSTTVNSTSKREYIKCTKNNILCLLEKDIFNLNDIIRDNQHLINRNLIDFDYIPESIKNIVIDKFEKLYA